MYIVLLGPPGSGKGTQGKILADHLKLRHISTGDLFRAILENPSHPLYSEVRVVKEGKLVSDEVVNRVVEDGLKGEEKQSGGVVFDGYPRTVTQAKALEKILESMGKKLDVVINFDVTQEVLLYRLLGRRICPNCKKIFHVSQGYTICPDCNISLVCRDDDNEETIMKRFSEYMEKTAPLRKYYKNSNIPYIELKITDKSKTPEEINNDIIERLKEKGII